MIDGCAFLRVVAFAEELQKNFPRIVLHRQRRVGVAERQRRIRAAAARRHLYGSLRRQFQRGQRGVLADVLGDHLIERRGHVRLGTAGIRTRGAEPRRGIEGMDRSRGSRVF